MVRDEASRSLRDLRLPAKLRAGRVWDRTERDHCRVKRLPVQAWVRTVPVTAARARGRAAKPAVPVEATPILKVLARVSAKQLLAPEWVQTGRQLVGAMASEVRLPEATKAVMVVKAPDPAANPAVRALAGTGTRHPEVPAAASVKQHPDRAWVRMGRPLD